MTASNDLWKKNPESGNAPRWLPPDRGVVPELGGGVVPNCCDYVTTVKRLLQVMLNPLSQCYKRAGGGFPVEGNPRHELSTG